MRDGEPSGDLSRARRSRASSRDDGARRVYAGPRLVEIDLYSSQNKIDFVTCDLYALLFLMLRLFRLVLERFRLRYAGDDLV